MKRLILFLIFGFLPIRSYAAFAFYRTITIDHTQCGAGNISDFPLYLNLVNDDFKVGGGGLLNGSGYDFRFYSDSGLTSALAYETERTNTSSGLIIAHVKVTCNASSDTVIYLAYDDAAVTTNGSSSTAWATPYKAIYHMGDGTTLSLLNSTSVANLNGTNPAGGNCSGSSGETSGQMDGASTYLIIGAVCWGVLNTGSNLVPLDPGTGNFTVSAWVHPTSNALDTTDHRIYHALSTDGNGLVLLRMTGDQFQAYYRDNSGNASVATDTTTTIVAGTWYHIAAVKVGTTAYIYTNGVQRGMGTGLVSGITISDTTTAADIGGNDASPGNFFDGDIDEVRLVAADLSAELIADYNNQKTGSTFYSLGAQAPVGGGSSGGGSLSLMGVGR